MGYAWLAEKKEQEMAKKLQRRGMPSYRQLPVSERYGVSYTGRGPDGKLQPQSPAGMEGRHIFHEGEMKADTPEGSMYLDAKTTGMAYPETEQQQAEMKMFEKSGNLPGFAAGGFASRLINAASSSLLPQPMKAAQSAVGTAAKAVTTLTQPQTATPSTTVQRINPREEIPLPQKTVQPIVAQPGSTVQNPIAPGTQQMVQPRLAGQAPVEPVVTPQTVNNMVPPPAEPQEPQMVQPRLAGQAQIEEPQIVNNMIPPPVENKPVETRTTEPRVETSAQTVNNMIPPIAGTQAEIAGKTTEDKAREQGMNWFLDALNKENPALMLEGRRALDELSSRQQQERSALEQQLIQQGVDPGRARVESRMLRDTQESELNDLASKFGIAGMKSRQEIAGTLATQGLQGQQFEAERNQYKDNADWKAYEAAIAAGDFDTAAQAYQRVTGKPINMDQMRTYQNFLNTRNQQELTSGDLDIDAKRFNLTTAKMQAMIADINNGVPLATINQTYGTNLDQGAYDSIGEKYKITMDSLRTKYIGDKINIISDAINKGASLAQINAQFPGTNLSLADYKAMQEATPLGERTWERNMSFAKTLLEAGGEANIQAAAGIFNQAFPGSGIDFSKLVTADKAASFNSGMNQLGTYVAAGMDWESALLAMQNDGTFDMLGFTGTQAEKEALAQKLYRGVKVNAIDEQYNQLLESDWWNGRLVDENGNKIPGPTEDQKRDIGTFYTAVLSGELDYSVQKEYTYKDAAGNTVTKRFKTEADAVRFATQNGVVLGESRDVVVPRTTTDGTGTDGTGVPIPEGKTPGQYFSKDGKTYRVDDNNKAVEVTAPTDAWGPTANDIIKGDPESDMAIGLIDQRARAIVDGDEPWSRLEGVSSDDPVYRRALDLATPITITRTNDKSDWRNRPVVDSVVKLKLADGSFALMKVIKSENNKGYAPTVVFQSLDGKSNVTVQLETMGNTVSYS